MVSLCFIQVTFAQESAVEWFNKGTKASDPDDKIRCYQKSIELDPNFVEAHYNLAYIYKNKNELEKALQLLNKALTLCGEETDKKLRLSIYYELGVCYKRVNNFPQSIEMFEKAKMLANDKKIRAHILYELGRVALLIEDFDKALAQFNEGLQISDKNKDLFQTAIEMTQKEKLLSSLYNKGMTLLQQKNYGQAIEALSKVKELDPNYKDTNLRLFEAQNQLQDRSDVASVDDLLNEGNSFFFNRNYNEALNKYKLVTEISPFNYRSYYNRGQRYEKSGDRAVVIAACHYCDTGG
ncbi:MAG: tetratricopeptide repeat protein [candidate division KSB1 bacterium]|nr:tetratricopeptide repeat protein [candidate division KSB1 bacterium]